MIVNKRTDTDIVRDISLLYELSLSTGRSVDLKDNINSFVTVLMSRKSIDIISVWIKDNYLHPNGVDKYVNIYGNPEFRFLKKELDNNHPIIIKLHNTDSFSVSYGDSFFEKCTGEQGIHKGVYTIFRLGDFGFIKMYQFARKYEWNKIEQAKLNSVIKQFSYSIVGCIDHTKSINELTKRLEAEKAVRKTEIELKNTLDFEREILELSSSFINLPLEEIDDGINYALKKIGSYINADRSYLINIHNATSKMSSTHEWCNTGIKSKKSAFQNYNINNFPAWKKRLENFKPIYLPDTSILSDEFASEKRIIESFPIKSLIAIPLVVFGDLEGFIGFNFETHSSNISRQSIRLFYFLAQAIGNARDRKRKGELIRKQELKYQDIVEYTSDFIYKVDKNRRFTFINEKALEKFGYSMAEIKGMRLDDLVENKSLKNVVRFYSEQINKNIPATYLEFAIKTKDKHDIWLGQNTTLSLSANNEHEFTMVSRDISDIVQANKSLKEAFLLAEKANKSKTQFIANTSHEMRTPVHGITGLIDILKDTELSDKQTSIVDKLEKITSGLSQLIDNVIDFKKIESDSLSHNKNPFSITKQIANIVETVQLTAKQNSVDIVLNIDKNIPETIIGDSPKLHRILINLVENAVKFTRHGTATIKILAQSIEENETSLHFELQDTGIGIPANIITNFTSDLDQGDSSYTRQYEGTGMGLYICNELISFLGGVLNIKSKKNIGTHAS
ncbi:MAG: ATP-binding protein, partial [Bacteroidota bacterium]|nr:ATP-binding protein [Bacteroidota bacterium]